ncbi:sensor histidine kinase [Agromyces ramosus]|uniref:histidine kinase n=1 Tax=Agromyces ramosus TaxID=33879 RepID=A0ABU0R4V1_9MICO|nr:histidine kinase [Agromyces ramosus]MDQ0893093.1 signal transduction histidine kinase [Agromyces ramosus]
MGASSDSRSTSSAGRGVAASGEPDREARPPTVADWVWAAACAAALLPVTVVELVREAGEAPDAVWLAGTIVLFVVLHLTVVVRRRSPRLALFGASAVMLLLTVASLPGTSSIAVLLPSSAAYLVFVFTAAASDDPWADVPSIVLGLLGAALITAVAIAHGPVPEARALISLGGFLVASIAAAWALGRYRRESRRKRAAQELGRRQSAELRLQGERAAVADERRRIGRELHDVISHSLAVMVAQAEASRVLLDRDETRARTAIEHVVSTGRTAMTDMRGLLAVLAEPPARAGAAAADAASPEPREPSPGFAELAALVERSAALGRAAVLTETGVPRPVSPGTALTVYRVVQESLTNTLKHTAPPTTSEVRLAWTTDGLVVTVVDDGALPAGQTSPSPVAPGRGIRGMRDRVEQAGGHFESGAGPHGGWQVRATFPDPEAVAHD